MKIERLKHVLAHPVSKRLAVAAPIGVGVGLLRAWLGEHSMLIGLLVGVGSYTFADWWFSTESERRARIQQTAAFLRKRWATGTKWGVYVLMCAYFFASRSEPQLPGVRQLLSLVESLGLVVVLIVPVAQAVIAAMVWEDFSVSDLVSRWLSAMALYAMALWSIGHVGDDIYGWVLANPHDAAVGVAALAVVWMIFRLSDRPAPRRGIIATSTGVATAVFVPTPTPRDNRYTAAHEAGHGLVYAALGDLPTEVQLAVNDRADEYGVLGFVTGIRSPHQLNEKTFAEWRMLVLLAGKVGESRLMGETTLGSSTDHARWLELAREYLSIQSRGVFYVEPRNEFEQKRNEEKLSALQADQLSLLDRLFDANADVFRELADSLLSKRTLARDELAAFLARVQLPEEFPRPSNGSLF